MRGGGLRGAAELRDRATRQRADADDLRSANDRSARQQLVEMMQAMHMRWPKAAGLLAAAEDEVMGYMDIPQGHWTRIYLSTARQARRTSSSG